MREITYDQAATEAIQEEFRNNPRAVHMSTDLAPELQQEFGSDRILVTPIAENNFVGASIGLAGSGVIYAGGFGDLLAEPGHTFNTIVEPPGWAQSHGRIVAC